MKISKEELSKLYLDNKLSALEIEEKTGIKKITLYWYMTKYNIPRRKTTEAAELAWKKGRAIFTEKMKEASITNISKARKKITKDSRKKQSESLMKRYDEGMKPWNFSEGRQTKTNRRVRTKRWIKLSKKIRKRDNNICQKCLKQKDTLQCHHIDGNEKNNDEDNLITVCCSCHMKESWKLGQLNK